MVLINPITGDTIITQATLSSYSWPLTVSGSAYITFGSPLVFTDVSSYFIIGTSGVVIDGCGNTVDISGVVNYPGLVRNGTSTTNGKSNTTIKNMGVRSIGNTTLATTQGWIGQQYYSSNASGNIIQNCYSTGNISNLDCGGIVGSFSAQTGNLQILNCYSTGSISGESTGGILGSYAGYTRGTIIATNCYSSGNMSGQYSGGIFGQFSAYNNGTVNATNCYSTGNMSAGFFIGGIFGYGAGGTSGTGTAIATNCYSTGLINNSSLRGGIFGGYVAGNVFAANCYVAGNANNTKDVCGNYVNGIFQNSPPYLAQSNCFVENGIYIWISTNASTTLTGQGSIWKTTGLPTDLFGQTGRYTLNSVPETYVNTNNTTIIQNQTFPLSFPDASYGWPLTITNSSSTNPITIKYSSPVVYTDASYYLIVGSPYITIDGCGNTVDVSGVVNYPGLVQNGTSTTNGKSNTTIKNLGVRSIGSTTLATSQGWIGQQYYSNNASGNIIQNCYSTGDISNNDCGGIVGIYAGQLSGGNILISDCSTTGAISNYSGGIFGSFVGYNYGTATSTNCYTKGTIGPFSGGIFGYSAASTNGTATSTNCYTTGDITGTSAGGIFGTSAGYSNGTATSTNCYTTGAITGSSAGGIFGGSAGFTNGTARANNCFVVGNISGSNNGGIFGNNPTLGVFANNCFVVSTRQAKDTSNNYVPGIFASSPGRLDQSNCIVDSYWNATDASNTLNYGVSSLPWITQTDPLGQPTFYKLASNPDTIPRNILSIYSTTTLDNTIPDGSFTWPLSVAGGSQATPTVLTLGADRIFPDANHYFIIGSNYITIDGSGRTIDISGVSNYPGLVQNGSSSTSKAFSNTTVQNIRATTKGGSFLPSSGGWIGQAYYGVSGQMNTVQHCSSTGVIGLDASSISCGGIVGQHSGGYGGQLVVFDCSSSGNITGTGSGGIAGQNSGRDGGRIDVSQCFSTGDITGLNGPGGIFGAGVAQTNGGANATNCYSTGRIAGLNAGGIFGRGAGTTSGNAKATNCYALGQIDASGGGGIFGSFAGNASTITALTKGNASAVNCYYDGSINNVYAGGIFGSYPSGNSGNDGSLGRVDVSSCYISLHYNVGTSANNYIYGTIVANDVSHVYITNTGYSTGEWNNGSANQYLYKVATTGNGNIWNANFIPYHLTAFDPLLGTINIITGNNVVFDQNAIDNTYSWPVTVQTSTATPTTIVFNGSVQLTLASTKYFVVNGQTVSLVSNSGTAASLTNTDTTTNSLFRGK